MKKYIYTKVQIAQLESTLKSDLVDKKKLMEALSKEREAYAKLESEFKDIQAKYFDVKEAIEGREEQVAREPYKIMEKLK